MPRQELHTGDLKTEQLPDIGADYEREPEIVITDKALWTKDYMEAIAFNEDPVTIRIEEGIEENSPTFHHCQVNGIGAEILINGRWVQYGHIPVGQVLTTKRKYLEVLLRSKRTAITHFQDEADSDASKMNRAQRRTSATMAISIISDPSPRGAAWITELYRRNY